MATYVVLARFTDQGVKNAKESPKRAEAFRQMAETFGVTVKDIFWTQGRYDIVIVIEAPDELSATALNLSLSALGNIRTESLRAFVDRHVEDRRQNALTRRFSDAQPTVMRANPETYRSEHHAKTLRLAEEAQAQNSNRD